MFKNITPQKLTIFISALVSFFNVIIVALYFLLSHTALDYILYLFFFVISFSISYVIIQYLIKRYIYQRIKPIYKVIRKSKLDKKAKIRAEDFNSNFLENLDIEVSEWANAAQEEIATLKSLEEYRKSYVGNISHELKTPLFSIQGYIHTILEDVEDEETRDQFLKRAAVNVDRLITIVQDLDSITKLDSDAAPLDIQAFNMKELSQEVIEDLELQARQKEVKVDFKDGASSAFFVKGDRENIRQVLSNLVLNSIKYGKIKGKTKISFYDLDKYVLIEVSDDGIGVEKKHLAHLFDRFYRVDKSRSRTDGGSGLGLSIVKHIIEAHGQDVNVRSTVGEGTTFGFTLTKATKK